MKKNKQYDVKHQKFEDELEYRDVKPADQSGDNDTDRIISEDEESKKATDEAYMKGQTKDTLKIKQENVNPQPPESVDWME